MPEVEITTEEISKERRSSGLELAHQLRDADHLQSDKETAAAAEAMFHQVDKSHDGMISKEEFVSLYSSMRIAMIEEHTEQRQLEEQRSTLRKQLKIALVSFFGVLVLILVLLGAFGVMTWALIEESKDTEVSHGGQLQVKGQEESVKAGGLIDNFKVLADAETYAYLVKQTFALR